MAHTETFRVLITGSSGFIGARLCEVMCLTKVFTPRAFVHSTASAARIARFELDFVLGDLCDAAAVDKAMRECDAVVHLARGGRPVMRKGLENVLRAAVKHKVSRFVHMSSLAVYGDNPPPASVSEETPARRTENVYGNEKLKQELRVLWYHSRFGLPVVILRPPNVSGPFSAFTTDLVGRLRSGRIAIVGDGHNPCNLVYIDNLVQAVLLALWKAEAVGEVFFVTDSEVVTWEQCLNDYAEMVGINSVRHIEKTDLAPVRKERMFVGSVRALPRALASAEFRGALRQVPVLKTIERMLYERFCSLTVETQQRLRLLLNGPILLSKADLPHSFSVTDNLVGAQARTVAHSNEKARRLLGYTSPVSYREGLALTKQWLRYSRVL